MLVFGVFSTVFDREGSKRRRYFQKIKSLRHEKNIYFSLFWKDLFFLSFTKQPWEFMAIFGNAYVNVALFWFYEGKKKYHRKDFHVWGLYFHVSCTVFFIIFEKFNLIYDNLTSTLLQNCNSFSSPSRI